MSLTSNLADKKSKIFQYFDKNFHFKKFIEQTNNDIKNAYTIKPENKINYPWSDVGHMTEYMMLLHMGIDIGDLFPMRFAKNEHRKFYAEIKLKYADSTIFFKSKDKFKEMCDDLYRLSKIEAQCRSGVLPRDIKKIMINENILKDMMHIYFKSLAVNETINNQNNIFYYNPTFALSQYVGGADADLYLVKDSGNFLIDLKTTIKSEIKEDMLFQLLGYVFLDIKNEHNLAEIGIYLTRQNLLSCWSVKDLVSNYSNFQSINDAKQNFEQAVIENLLQKN